LTPVLLYSNPENAIARFYRRCIPFPSPHDAVIPNLPAVIPNGVRDLHCALFFSQRDTPIVKMLY